MDENTEHPNFRKLMEMLGSQLTAGGASIAIVEDLNEARERLQEAKEELFKKELIFEELHEIMLELSDKRSKQISTSDEDQAYTALQEALRNAEAKNYLKISLNDEDPCKSNLFALTEDKLGYKESKKRNMQQILQQYFVPDVEQRLKERCINVTKLWDSKCEGESDGLILAKSAKLPFFVENEMKKTADDEKALMLGKGDYQKLLVDYQKALNEYMENLEEIIDKYPLDSQAKKTKSTVEWLEAKCEALQLKIKVLHCQLLKDTYDQDSITALKKVKEHLDKALAESKSEVTKLEHSLNAYQSVGPGFDALVKEYARLTAEIDNRKWALAELRRAQQKD